MKILKKILDKFNGLYYCQEYLCLAKESFPDPLHVYLIFGNKVIKDITNLHLFTAYHPLIFSLPAYKEINLSETGNIEIIFSPHQLLPNDFVHYKDAIAKIFLTKIHEEPVANGFFYHFRGAKGVHRFISPVRQWIIQLQNRFYNRKPGNVYLPGNLLNQVQIAYSLPRTISLITVGIGDQYNLFPTDLHGQINEGTYIISLRKGGKAAQQIELAKRILISEVDASTYKAVYAFGKNHMKELMARDQFPFSEQSSQYLQLPLPNQSTFYRELELVNHSDHGIHRLFVFKIINQKQMKSNPATLAHVHNVYATWRRNQGLPGNYLLR